MALMAITGEKCPGQSFDLVKEKCARSLVWLYNAVAGHRVPLVNVVFKILKRIKKCR